MHTQTLLTHAVIGTVPATALRHLLTDSIDKAAFAWTPFKVTFWTGLGGLRTPERSFPALCPGAYWLN